MLIASLNPDDTILSFYSLTFSDETKQIFFYSFIYIQNYFFPSVLQIEKQNRNVFKFPSTT